MRRARKKPVRVNAYRLGEQSEGLDRLIKEGLVSQSDDGTFEVHTMETKDEKGETAHAGDYVKLDAAGRPYPNKAEFFEKNHRHIDGDQYEQFPKDREVWMMGDGTQWSYHSNQNSQDSTEKLSCRGDDQNTDKPPGRNPEGRA